AAGRPSLGQPSSIFLKPPRLSFPGRATQRPLPSLKSLSVEAARAGVSRGSAGLAHCTWQLSPYLPEPPALPAAPA
ncbi:hypothetical protein NDU88_005731, partial [Pleurodeles waltl]